MARSSLRPTDDSRAAASVELQAGADIDAQRARDPLRGRRKGGERGITRRVRHGVDVAVGGCDHGGDVIGAGDALAA